MKPIACQVVHSETKSAWNIVSTALGCKYKIARIPYHVFDDEVISMQNRKEAKEHADFICECLCKGSVPK